MGPFLVWTCVVSKLKGTMSLMRLYDESSLTRAVPGRGGERDIDSYNKLFNKWRDSKVCTLGLDNLLEC